MTRQIPRGFTNVWARPLTALALVGACTVVNKGDYTFTDTPGDEGGESGSSSGGKGGSSGSSSGTTGKGGTSGEAGDGNGGTTAGTSGDAGAGGEGGLCNPNPCEHGGRCTQSGTTTGCDCAPGYEGVTCGDEIDECDPNPCENNAPCTDLVADFSCMCPQQLTGKSCELPRFQGIPAPMVVMGQAALARAVSADGTVVLGEVRGTIGTAGVARPFIWSVDDGSRLVPLPSAIRADVTVKPWSISGDGSFWVGEFHGTSSMNAAPAPIGGPTVPPGENQPLPMFGIPANALGGYAFDTNEDGTVSVGNFTDGMAGSAVHALRFNEMGMSVPLSNPFGQASPLASAGAVTRDGALAAGTVKDGMGNVYIYFWGEAGSNPPGQVRTMTGIADLEVHGMSSTSSTPRTAGTYWNPQFQTFAFLTDGSRFVPLGLMMNGVASLANAWDVSDDGNFIVGDMQLVPGMMALADDVLEQTTGSVQQAVIWKPDGTFRTVVDVLRDSNVMPVNWQLLTAYGCSADGKVVVGAARDPNGVEQGFIARLP